MAWTTPKTSWVNGEYYNVADHMRIVGNIRYLSSLLSITPTVKAVDVTTVMTADYFNTIVTDIDAIALRVTWSAGLSVMRSYYTNGKVWSASDLNAIEGNTLKLYDALRVYRAFTKRLAFTLGGEQLG